MKTLPYLLIAVSCLGAVLYFLYYRGILITKSIAAILFVFRNGHHQDQARLNACTGWVQHAGRFRESRAYEFTLSCRLSQGNAEAVLLDGNRQELLRFNQHHPSGTIRLDGRRRYFLRWSFQNATGQCELHW